MVRPGQVMLAVQPFGDLLPVALVVQGEQEVEDFNAGTLADCKSSSLLRIVKAMAEIEVGPTIGRGYSLVSSI